MWRSSRKLILLFVERIATVREEQRDAVHWSRFGARVIDLNGVSIGV